MSQALDWVQVRQDFESDGSLRDIYVLETRTSDWQRLLDHLRSSGRALRFSVDGLEQPLPTSASAVLALRAQSSPVLNLDVQGIDLACHFFTDTEIEFDLLPQQVRDEATLSAVLGFMTEIGSLLGKTVILTPENWQKSPIFKYDPASQQTTYCPPSDV